MLSTTRINRALPRILERALKTFAQSLLAAVAATGVADAAGVDWPEALGIAGLAALVSVLTSVASWKLGPERGPSLVPEPRPKPSNTSPINTGREGTTR